MAEEQDQEDKTEEPTLRKLEKAKEEGQVLRSQEATTAAVTLGVIAALYFSGSWLGAKLMSLFGRTLNVDPLHVFQPPLILEVFGRNLAEAFLIVTPLFLLAVFFVVVAAAGVGGMVFSLKAAAPKLSKINPIKGFTRIFGLRALVELCKAILKFGLVAGVASLFLYFNLDLFFAYGWSAISLSIADSLKLVFFGATITSIALLVIAAVDIPYQRFEFIKKLKMSKKDVKDELKEMEGQPEVRQQIRRKQRELAEQRMMEEVPKADVVITNPQHFAVALVYDIESLKAPKVLAKGKDLVARRIKERARETDVQIFEAPPLARALYFSVDIGAYIPESLFQSVAQVIAYVYGIKAWKVGTQRPVKPKPRVPGNMFFDEKGKPITR